MRGSGTRSRSSTSKVEVDTRGEVAKANAHRFLRIRPVPANTRPEIQEPTKRPCPTFPEERVSARGHRGPLERQAQVAHGSSTPSRPPGAATEGRLMGNSPPAFPLTYFLRRV